MEIRIEAGRYFLRALREVNASNRWAGWIDDPDVRHLLNAPARRMTKNDVVEYIKSFDQRSRLLLGVFDRDADLHIGFITVSIDEARSGGVFNMMIGEAAYRNGGVLTAIREPLSEFLFETLDLPMLRSSVLAHNLVALQNTLQHGWVHEKTLPKKVRSHRDGTMLDLCLVSYSREAWRAGRGTKAE